MAEVDRDQARLWFTSEGPAGASPVLLLHALGTAADLWDPQAPALARAHRVIRCDTRGHGRSTASPGPTTLELLGRDALAVLDAAGAERAHVCGVSLGGQVAMWLAACAPDRVGRLLLANTAARIGSEALWNERIGAVRAGGLEPLADAAITRWLTEPFRCREPAIAAALRRRFVGTSPEGYAGCCAAIRDADLEPALSAIRAPTLVITGLHDEATPPALGERVRHRIPGARHLSLPGAHLTNVECAADFTAALCAFLAPDGD